MHGVTMKFTYTFLFNFPNFSDLSPIYRKSLSMQWKELSCLYYFNYNKNISLCKLYVSVLSPKYVAI